MVLLSNPYVTLYYAFAEIKFLDGLDFADVVLATRLMMQTAIYDYHFCLL